MKRVRCFVALNLPVEAIDQVAVVQRELRQAAAVAGVRVGWVPPPNMHVTLKFLGEVPAECVFAIRDCLAEGLRDRRSWFVEIATIGVFPTPKRPRIIWIGLDDEGQTAALAADVDRCLVEVGFDAETRAFHPHLTLGRVKGGPPQVESGEPASATDSEPGDGGTEFWEPWRAHRVGRFLPGEVVLYSSELSASGAEYAALGRVELQGVSSNVD